jgi:hypothetical protein
MALTLGSAEPVLNLPNAFELFRRTTRMCMLVQDLELFVHLDVEDMDVPIEKTHVRMTWATEGASPSCGNQS